jgi:hypothetical protein
MKASDILIINGQQKFEVEPIRKPNGHIIIEGQEIADTLQCCHCGHHWIPVKGSGRTRGFCTKCNGVTCGRPECMECVPYEKRLDLYEKGKLKILK